MILHFKDAVSTEESVQTYGEKDDADTECQKMRSLPDDEKTKRPKIHGSRIVVASLSSQENETEAIDHTTDITRANNPSDGLEESDEEQW